MVGTTVSHYKILEQLGKGGMGVVYRAEDLKLGRHVALKFLPDDLAGDAEALARFQREARAASALNHPRICTIHELAEDQGRPFIVMEMMDGETLKYRIAGRPLPADLILRLGAQVAGALEAAHSAGVVHRDLKPANLFVTRRGDVKVLDFGLAKLTEGRARDLSGGTEAAEAETELAPEQLTTPGTAMGTVAYMSPEQVRGEELDERTDLFSLGVVLYEMATGRQPFGGPTAGAIFDRILHHAPTAPVRLNPSLPEGLEHILDKALEKDKALRYQSATEMKADLLRLARDTTIALDAVVSGARASGSRRLWFALGAVALVALGAIGVWRLRPSRPDRAGAAGDAKALAAPAPALTSIAVLPFQNLGADTSVDYLRLAVPDEITTTLSRITALSVRPFSVTAKYADGQPDLRAAGEELRAGNLLTGQYYAEDTALTFTLEVVAVPDNAVVWRSRVSAPKGDLLALRAEIAGRIRSELLPELGFAPHSEAGEHQPTNAEAYELYIRSLATPSSDEPNKQAIQLLRESLALEPEFARAWSELSLRLYYYGQYADGGPEALREADAAASRAIELDPRLLDPQAQLNSRRVDAGDLQGAFREAQRMVENRPDSPFSWFGRSYVFRYAGMLEEAARDCLQALSLDPVNRRLRSCALVFAMQQEWDRAYEFLALDPGTEYFHDVLGHFLIAQGKPGEALASVRRQSPDSVWQREGDILEHCGERTEEAAAAAALAAREVSKVNDSEPMYWVGGLLATCGFKDAALEMLGLAITRGYCSYPALDHDPQWTSVRGDPEFVKLRQKAVACHERFREFVRAMG